MALQGETIGLGAPNVCPDCDVKLEEMVLKSAAGFYIGTQCNCGPYSRESLHYWTTRVEALHSLACDDWQRRDETWNKDPLGVWTEEMEEPF